MNLGDRTNESQTAPAVETLILMRDGNQILAMVGPDLQVGIGGFGNTAAEALRDLADRMEAEKYRLPGIDFLIPEIHDVNSLVR